MSVSDRDHELLSALHDGELERGPESVLRGRLEREPELRRALAEISEVSAALQPLRPDLAAGAVASRGRVMLRASLAAVAVVAAVLVGSLFFAGSVATSGPVERHNLFAAQAYEVRPGASVIPAAALFAETLDLSAANLWLVDMAGDLEDEIYFHYSGVNGCRLTFGVHSEAPVLPASGKRLLTHLWATRGRHYSLVAAGMDANRFAAIANMLEDRTRPDPFDEGTLLAVRDATRTAVPCA